MLSEKGCRERRERLLASEPSFDWMVIRDPHHLMYLANYYADPFVFRSVNSGAMLLLARDGTSILVADSMVRGFAQRSLVDEVHHPTWYDGVHSAPVRSLFLVEQVARILSGREGKRIGVEWGHGPHGLAERLLKDSPGLAFGSIDSTLATLKRAKDADELALIRQSIRAIEAGFAAGRERIHAGMSELDAFHVIERASREKLGQQMPIYGDFVSGPNTEGGGGPPTDRIIREGDLFLLDYSVVVFGYRGDFANSWVVDAKASDEARYLHESSREALAEGEKVLGPGVPAKEVDRAVKASFAGKGLEHQFTSHSGHGLGLGHPDPPYFVSESSDVLVEGDVVAIEPSQKVAGLGTIRVEHNYLITSSGFERLSNHLLTID